MKKLLYFILPLFLILTACKDSFIENDSDLSGLKSAKKEKFVTINGHGRFTAISNLELPRIACVPEAAGVTASAGGWIDGYGNLIGNVNGELSTYEITSCEFDPSSYMVTAYGKSTVVGANGDMYFIDVVQYLDVLTKTFTGHVDLTGGTGKFEDAGGHFEMVNGVIHDDGTTSWEGYGEYILKK